jgi:hypothetical protein
MQRTVGELDRSNRLPLSPSTELVLHRHGRVVVTRFAAAIGVYALLYWLWFWLLHPFAQHGRFPDDGTWLEDLSVRLGFMGLKLSLYCYPVVLGGALLLTLGGYIVRSRASTLLQQGRRDPLDGVRAWADRHPRLRKLPVVAPAAIFAAFLSQGLLHLVHDWSRFRHPTTAALAIVVVAAGSAIAMGRAVLLGTHAVATRVADPRLRVALDALVEDEEMPSVRAAT